MMSERTIHIVCPQCRSGFDVDAEAIGPNGRTLMCSECEHRWFYQHDAEAPALDEHTPSTEEEIPAPEPEVDTQEKPPIIEAATPEAEGGAIREKVSFFTTQMFLVPIILGLLFTVMFFARNEVVRFLPASEKFYSALGISTYNIGAFRFHKPGWKVVETGNLKSITVSGRVINTSERLLPPPAIQVTLRGHGICKTLSWTDQIFNQNKGSDGSCTLSRWTFRLKEGRLFSGQTSSFEMTYPVGLNQKPSEVLLKFVNTE